MLNHNKTTIISTLSTLNPLLSALCPLLSSSSARISIMIKGLLIGTGALLLAALPGTNNYQLRDYGFGSGGGTTGSSNYSLEGLAGEISGQFIGTDNYGLKPGLLGSQLSALPAAPDWQNPDDWYNKLQLIINTSGNPADTTYAVAISSDGFATTQYVQSDSTMGSALGLEDFRDYNGWGGAGGMNVIGLRPTTTYEVRVKARQGEFSETGFGPTASAVTSQASLTFDIDISATDAETLPPYNLAFGSVNPETVTDSPELIWLDIASNAESGAYVYIVSDNGGLVSPAAGHTISAVTGDLDSLNEGIGAQNTSTSTGAGGPLSVPSPFNGSSDVIGAVDSQFRQLLVSSGPLASGRASFLLKIKTDGATPAANDYSDIYTLIATAAF